MPAAADGTVPPPRRRLGADVRRAQIVRAAIEVVEAAGYAQSSLTAIAATAGVAKGLLWHYFEDRDDLMRQVAASIVQELRTALVAELDVTAPAPEVIRAVFARTALFTRSHGAELEVIDQIVHNLRTPDGRQRMSMLDYEDTYAEHELLLARGQREGTIRPADLRVMAVGYQGAIDTMIGYLQAHPDLDPVPYAEKMSDLFLSGACSSPPSC